jgi:hypothetical protein
LRALYVITGDWFVIPISVSSDKVVRSVDCYDDGAWVFDSSGDGSFVRPFAEIGGSQ